MNRSETIKMTAAYVVDCRGLIARLDSAPAMVRIAPDVQKARALAKDSLILVDELLKRLRAEIESERDSTQGVQYGEE